MAIRKKLKQGFTLVELMIVVAIVGVLAVLAVYGVRKYIANAKTAEAKNSLGQIGKDAVTAFEGERMKADVLVAGAAAVVTRKICPPASAPVPPTGFAAVKGQKYQSKAVEWSPSADVLAVAGFPCLKFEMTAPQYYAYMFESDSPAGSPLVQGTVFTATANGDLNGDGVPSTFRVFGKIPGGTDTRLLVSPSIDEISPEE